MQQSNQETYPYQTDEIDLRKLFNSLVARKLLIFGLTSFVTLLAIMYALILTPTYKAISSFTPPSDSSLIYINKTKLTSESKESVFTAFLSALSSQDLQIKVFNDGGYLNLVNPENKSIDDVNNFIARYVQSIKISPPEVTMKELELGFLTQIPYSISMEGNKAEVISRFLNELVVKANNQTISDMNNLVKQKIAIRLDEISVERGLLLTKAERDRLSQIERIKEEDAQKIREINDQIDRVRFQAKENRLNQIVVLTDAAKLAGSLGIIENNLKQISEGNETNFNLNIAINEDEDLPEWYLYGEKALLERIEILESRTNDDAFITELVTLTNQLNEVQNNNLLETLEARKDDDPFIPEITTLKKTLKEVQLNNLLETLEERQNDSPFITLINELDIEKIQLESTIVDMSGANSMKLQLAAVAPTSPIKPNKRMIVLLAFIGGFMISILLALVMGALKPDEKHSI